MIQFGEYLPDLPPLDNPGATVANNVFPRTDKSYGPVAGLSAISTALDARCQGAYPARDAAGNVFNFAGSATKLYKTDANSTFSDVSTTSFTYATSSEEHWKFVQYAERVIATNYADAMQTYIVGTSTSFSTMAAAAPKARHIAIIRDFVMVGNTNDSGDGSVPYRIWWCAQGDPTSWPTIGSAAAAAAQSDYNDIYGDGWCQGLVGAIGGADGAAFFENGVYRISYEGPPTVFRFDKVEGARGTPAPGSIIQVGAFAYYLGEDGFYVFDGANSIPIGTQKVDKTFFADLDQNYFYRISASSDPINKLVIWAYPGSGNTGGNPNKLLIYNWESRRWSTADIDCELIYRSLSQGYTLDQLDAFGTMETLPFSLDSRAWTGGRYILSAFNTSHKLSYFTGSNLAATIETGEFSRPDGRRMFVSATRPLINGGTITCAVGHRDTPQASVTYNTATSAGVDGNCPQRQSARYMRLRASVAAGGSWTHAQGFEPTIRAEGWR